MALNKQSNIYTIVYIIVLVTVVGAGLAFTSMALKSRQTDNANADKMRQILASVHVMAENGDIKGTYAKYITGSLVVNSKGQEMKDAVAFDVNVAKQSKLADADRLLPVYICKTENGETKYILPVYGAGLWGPIWGYVAVNADGASIYGAYFAHQGETPGLGAEIEKPKFADEFNGRPLWRGDVFTPTEVVKAGQRAADDPYSVDGVSGGTITSRGVSAMLHDCLMPYAAYLETLKGNTTAKTCQKSACSDCQGSSCSDCQKETCDNCEKEACTDCLKQSCNDCAKQACGDCVKKTDVELSKTVE